MTLTPGNVSMLLALLSSVAPGTLAIVAGILGALVGYFGKRYLKQNDCPTCANNSKPSSKVPGRDASGRFANSGRRKKDAPTSRE